MKKLLNSQGISLILVPLVFIVIGAFIVAIWNDTKPQQFHKQIELQDKMERVRVALSVFAQKHSRLPCPADPSDTGTAFGAEDMPEIGEACDVVEGVVPYKTLGIPQSDALDNGYYFTYAVSPTYTRPLGANPDVDPGDDPDYNDPTILTADYAFVPITDNYYRRLQTPPADVANRLIVPDVEKEQFFTHAYCRSNKRWILENQANYVGPDGEVYKLETAIQNGQQGVGRGIVDLNTNMFKAQFCCASNLEPDGTDTYNFVTLSAKTAISADDKDLTDYDRDTFTTGDNKIRISLDRDHICGPIDSRKVYWNQNPPAWGVSTTERADIDSCKAFPHDMVQVPAEEGNGNGIGFVSGSDMHNLFAYPWSTMNGFDPAPFGGNDWFDYIDPITTNAPSNRRNPDGVSNYEAYYLNKGKMKFEKFWVEFLDDDDLVKEATFVIADLGSHNLNCDPIDPNCTNPTANKSSFNLRFDYVLPDGSRQPIINPATDRSNFDGLNRGSYPIEIIHPVNESQGGGTGNHAFVIDVMDYADQIEDDLPANGRMQDVALRAMSYYPNGSSTLLMEVKYVADSLTSTPNSDLVVEDENGVERLPERDKFGYLHTNTPAETVNNDLYEAPIYVLYAHSQGEGSFIPGTNNRVDNIPAADENEAMRQNEDGDRTFRQQRQINAEGADGYGGYLIWDTSFTLLDRLGASCEQSEAMHIATSPVTDPPPPPRFPLEGSFGGGNVNGDGGTRVVNPPSVGGGTGDDGGGDDDGSDDGGDDDGNDGGGPGSGPSGSGDLGNGGDASSSLTGRVVR